MARALHSLPVFLCVAALLLPVGRGPEELNSEDLQFFENRIRPLLAEHGCKFHATTSKRIKGVESGVVIVPGNPQESLLFKMSERGLLASTLLVLSGEFGRTPFAQGRDGRDHNPQGFSLWMAGGGIRGGTVYGAKDKYGYSVVENKLTVHEMHANCSIASG